MTCPHIVTSDEGTSYCALAEGDPEKWVVVGWRKPPAPSADADALGSWYLWPELPEGHPTEGWSPVFQRLPIPEGEPTDAEV